MDLPPTAPAFKEDDDGLTLSSPSQEESSPQKKQPIVVKDWKTLEKNINHYRTLIDFDYTPRYWANIYGIPNTQSLCKESPLAGCIAGAVYGVGLTTSTVRLPINRLAIVPALCTAGTGFFAAADCAIAPLRGKTDLLNYTLTASYSHVLYSMFIRRRSVVLPISNSILLTALVAMYDLTYGNIWQGFQKEKRLLWTAKFQEDQEKLKKLRDEKANRSANGDVTEVSTES